MSSYEPIYPHTPPAPQFPPLGSISVWFGVIVVVVTAVAQTTTGQHDVWALPFLQAMQLVLIILLLGSTMYLLLGGDGRAQAALPLFINIGVLLIIRFVPFGTIWQDVHFQGKVNDYNTVVQMMESGAFSDGWVALPDQYDHLSGYQGQVFVTTLANGGVQIIFPTTAVADGKMTGYVYRTDDQTPQSNLFTWRYVVAKRPYWFFCSSL